MAHSAENLNQVNSDWTMSLDAEASGEYAVLQAAAEESYRNSTARVLFQSAFDQDDSRDPIKWIYPFGEYSADALSHSVLSGEFGEELLKTDKALRTEARQFGLPPLDEAILVAGAALARVRRPDAGLRRGATYGGAELPDGSATAETCMGGDSTLHGDFRIFRYFRPQGSVKTTLDSDREHVFMPVAEMQHVIADREVGSVIAAELLKHMVERRMAVYEQATPDLLRDQCRQLYDEIRAKADVWRTDSSADMAKYTSSSVNSASSLDAFLLYYMSDPHQKCTVGTTLFGVQRSLYAEVAEGGVRFVTKGIDSRGVTIPDAELPDFVAALVSGGGHIPAPEVQSVVDALAGEGVGEL